MTDPSTTIENRSLAIGKWANLFMAAAGITAASLSRSDALLVDGLYSGVNFLSAIVAAKVGVAVTQPPDRSRPFGYEAEEPLYVSFRSLFLLGIIAYAVFAAAEKIFVYATGGSVPELVFGPILVYVGLMVAICLGLAGLHHYSWERTGRRSAILRAESRASLVDGTISAGAGGALLAVPLLAGTPVAFVIPVADAVVVLVMGVIIVREPLRMFREALQEAAGGAATESMVKMLRERTVALLDGRPYALLDLAVSRLGRSHFVAAYIKPERAVVAAEIDTLRTDLESAYADEIAPARTVVILTEQHPFE